MNILLPQEADDIVNYQVASGRFGNPDEVVLAALRLLSTYDAARQSKLKALKQDLQLAIDQSERGEVAPLDIDKTIAEGLRRYAQRGHNAANSSN